MFVAWRDLRFAKGRFALMGAVVILITVLVGLLSGLTAGLARQSTSAITGLPADQLVFAAPAAGQDLSFTDSAIPERTWSAWEGVSGVETAAPLGITTTRAGVGSRTAAVSAFGVRPGSDLAPAPGVAPGAAVLSDAAAEALDARPGQQVELGGQPFVVEAVAGDASFSHLPVVWVDLDSWQTMSRGDSAGGEQATVLALTTSDDGAFEAADQELGTQTVARDASLAAIGSYTSENGSLQLMRGFLFAISALVIGAFFTVWTIQRSGDVAVLKALGASTRYLLRDALGQAVVLLVIGTTVGTAIAAAVGASVSGIVPFVLDGTTVLVPALVLTVLGAAGAALSIRRITSVDPLTALGSAR